MLHSLFSAKVLKEVCILQWPPTPKATAPHSLILINHSNVEIQVFLKLSFAKAKEFAEKAEQCATFFQLSRIIGAQSYTNLYKG
jgi:hypothetical protein